MASLLGLDLGEKRVGVALAEEGSSLALPLVTLEIRGRRHLAEQLRDLIRDYRAVKLVVGLPKTLSGEMGPAAIAVTETVEWLRGELELPMEFWDERLSSQEVERVLQEGNVKASKRKQVRDQLAAQRILQNYLDAMRHQND